MRARGEGEGELERKCAREELLITLLEDLREELLLVLALAQLADELAQLEAVRARLDDQPVRGAGGHASSWKAVDCLSVGLPNEAAQPATKTEKRPQIHSESGGINSH